MDRRVLLVDDDPAMLALLSRYLRGAEYEVLVAQDGPTALGILHRDGPPIVLSDWAMPGMSGLQLCQTIRASEAIGFVYVIIVTAHSEKHRVVEALEAGANDFLAKPFHPQELLARVNAGFRITTLEADLKRQQRELCKANAEMAILNRKLELMAITDELTGLANRREAMHQLKTGWDVAQACGQPFSCIMVDIDHFKDCNDTYGHDAGDAVLRHTAEALLRMAGTGELACRLGGEEFLLICPNAGVDHAAMRAEQLRAAVEASAVQVDGVELHVTISAGVAERSAETDTVTDLLKCADQALYAAKRAGRNRVMVHETFGQPTLLHSFACP
ncbi:MAG TPA: diguanylate cyclase [Phycisphaerae bacterium]|nr:diguanylate cyclase [Phycisphaerae bacterium]HOM50219.1 diguanylate cyclase [Phycisphaerae bacterium]HOQ86841.1 diguanylate cyclase [Phycisphaerae bacterium]HPP27524.1 diguanylate cyclase [Phycisphaerae bacterium]HPU25179.1 diguanylate cyclase [Phycisphaerae bacterium]